jgi:2-keto-4-pentenoate hydratase/2-oxohepta-3-ene-1,7-dioic acid hydratase in catechol pathway
MKIVRYEKDGKIGIGLVEEGSIVPLKAGGKMRRMISIHGDNPGNLASLTSPGEKLEWEEARIRAPIKRPGKIVCLGRNYAAHAAESGMSVPDEPIIFPKASSSVIGTGDAIVHHRICTRVDHEVELAVIIGSKAWRTARKDAMDKVFGYTVINDVSARKMQIKDIELRNPWFRSKSLDTFCPMGPWIVTRDEVKDPQQLELECRVNGEIRQKGNTRDMIFPVDELIEFTSTHMTLEPGDIISTGTPEGISAILPGEVVECRVQGVGTISNPVVKDED